VHPTQKPLVLMQRLVEQFTDPGDVILDPTAGSGTTGLAAKLLSRRAVLVESNEEHCEAAAKRLQTAVPPALVPITATETFDFGGAA
jgi:site-specific DNA-methyltransferase (adenine-specific)